MQGFIGKNTARWKSQKAGSVFDLSHTLIYICNMLSTSHTDIKAKSVLNEKGKQQWLFTVLNTGLSQWTSHVNPYQLWQTAASGLPFTKPPTPGEWEETRSFSASYLSSGFFGDGKLIDTGKLYGLGTLRHSWILNMHTEKSTYFTFAR